METGIGAILRDARNRRKVDHSEVEAATKIRARYLRAMENEDWDVLPGGAYTRGFIRTYASYLGLDGERLSEEFRASASVTPTAPERGSRIEPMASGRPPTGPRPPGWVWAALVGVVLVGILVAVGLAGNGDDEAATPGGGGRESASGRPAETTRTETTQAGVVVLVEATGEVWTCMVDAAGEPVIDGELLEAGDVRGPYRRTGFSVAFGNGEVTMQIDGGEAEIPATSSPIGFEIAANGELTDLEEGERPDCE